MYTGKERCPVEEYQYQAFEELSPNHQLRAITLLAEEFWKYKSVALGIERFKTSLESGKEKALCVIEGNNLLGAITTKTYRYQDISQQIYIEAKYDPCLTSLRFQRFHELLTAHGFPKAYEEAVEIAYVVVEPMVRGKGVGGELFRKVLSPLTETSNNPLIFTLARGIYAQSNIQDLITQHVLEYEASVNGFGEDGKAVITGLWIPSLHASQCTGYDIPALTPYSGSPATIHTFEKYGARPIGFSRNFSPVWCIA